MDELKSTTMLDPSGATSGGLKVSTLAATSVPDGLIGISCGFKVSTLAGLTPKIVNVRTLEVIPHRIRGFLPQEFAKKTKCF
jgi:hypothetical protein